MNVRGQSGLLGKLTIFWLIVLAVIAVAVIDFASITTTRFHLADAASTAALEAAGTFKNTEDVKQACQMAADTLATADPAIRFNPSADCLINPSNGNVTITVKKEAHTFLAGRLGFTQKYTKVVDTETSAPPTL
jgi:uncharacterized membrane protein